MSIRLQDGTTVQIGRGFFEVTDKRVSRKHGEITVMGHQIKIKACHVNPIFYKKSGSVESLILMKDLEVTLVNRDKFSLLPNEFEYEVRVEIETPAPEALATAEETTSELRVRNIGDINSNLEAGTMATSLSQVLANSTVVEATNETNESDSDHTPSDLDMTPPDFAANSTDPSDWRPTRKRSIEENLEAEESNKKMKSSNSEQVVSKDGATSSVQSEINNNATSMTPQEPSKSVSIDEVKIKPDPDSVAQSSNNLVKIKPDPDVPSSSTSNTAALPINIKSDPDTAEVPVKKEDPPTAALPAFRPSCQFGVRCYRHAPDHRTEFAHPADADYRRPDFPPAPAGTPDCPFGASCYRRNPDHFVRLQHPSSSEFFSKMFSSLILFISMNDKRSLSTCSYTGSSATYTSSFTTCPSSRL